MRRIYTAKEAFLRSFHREVREFKEILERKGVLFKTYAEADDYDICLASLDETEKGYHKEDLENNGSERYFVESVEYFKMLDDEFYFT